MKFSVAPESTRAMASALFAIEWTKNRTVIDFRADIYTLLLLFCLISADLIRQCENPQLGLLPFLLPIVLSRRQIAMPSQHECDSGGLQVAGILRTWYLHPC